MTSRALVLSAALLSFIAAPATQSLAATVTGQQLLSLCTANMWGKGKSLEAAECLGFVVGVSDTFNCEQSDHGFTWNSAEGVSQPRMVAVVIQWLQTHPESLQYEGHRVVGAALQNAYPCK